MCLAQVDKLAEFNSGVKYLMIIVDLFSRFVRVGTMRNKTQRPQKLALLVYVLRKMNLLFRKNYELIVEKSFWQF